MATVTSEPEAPTVDAELIADSTEAALRMQLGTSTREDIDARTRAVTRQLTQLLAQGLDADEDAEVTGLFRQGYRLLERVSRPTKQTAAFNAFFYMRDVANLARRLLWIYIESSRHAT
ncbi:hypothetical protein [Streptomyces sp. NBC_00140]|uniref:hypothetical protein n=1 Tax=Streptomyces sp. NBC_00140 TaxID=2975664 RepID=UPI00225241C3|nr:hypothetical protein [Streptomyces sp. NBC_00140]MCX5336815.1 hypothetical protein [Streptomyces sp. NBC_00140]